MAVGPAELGEAAMRGDEHQGATPEAQRMGGQGGAEAEGGRPVAMSRREHLVQRAQGQAGSRQIAVDLRQSQGEMGRGAAGRSPLQSRQLSAQGSEPLSSGIGFARGRRGKMIAARAWRTGHGRA